ncbi:MAG: hypothetical protein QOJ94_2961 [Sphingomonadales bacterium]|nr:hypothetical protein [Sphingomonadales bacterium]
MSGPRGGDGSAFLLLARAGFVARGIMYLLVAWLALRLGRGEDAGKALAYLASGPGRAVLAVMAIAFAGYAAWRLTDAALDTQRRGRDTKALGKRFVAAGSGCIHAGLAFSAARLALGHGGSGGGSSRTAETGAATALHLPGGEALLLAAAAVLAGVAVAQLAIGIRFRFLHHMTPQAERHWWVKGFGAAGYCARGLIFAAAAWLMVRAGMDHAPREAGGLGDSLRAMPGLARPAVAAGLGLFGLFSLIEAWFRDIRDPKLGHRMKRAAAR